jgi:hypothetical protein
MELKEKFYVTPIGLVGFTGMINPVMTDEYLLQCVADSNDLRRKKHEQENINFDTI